MTSREMWQEYKRLLNEKGITHLDGITTNTNKKGLQNAIDCLNCSDETLNDYLIVVKLLLPNTYEKISKSNFKLNPFNRLYVYNTARLYLEQ